ncbi:MAG: GNAT family N-acetyltransferase, partial [Cyclobacteriaceae bacterium]
MHKNIDDTKTFLDHLQDATARGLEFGYGIIEKNSKEFMGTIGFKNESGRVFFGYILAPEYHGKG